MRKEISREQNKLKAKLDYVINWTEMPAADRSSKQKKKLSMFCLDLKLLYNTAMELGFSVHEIQLPTYFGTTVYYAFCSFIPPFLRETEPVQEETIRALLGTKEVCK